MTDDGISETDRVETVYTVGPGLRMAIIFVCFIFTLGTGFYGGYSMSQSQIKGADKANQVEVLKSDTREGLQLVKDYFEIDDKIRKDRVGRVYDKDCGDKLISDIIK